LRCKGKRYDQVDQRRCSIRDATRELRCQDSQGLVETAQGQLGQAVIDARADAQLKRINACSVTMQDIINLST